MPFSASHSLDRIAGAWYNVYIATLGGRMKRKGLNIRIDENLRHDFHRWCLDNNTTMAAELRRHIENVVYWCVGPATTKGVQDGLATRHTMDDSQ